MVLDLMAYKESLQIGERAGKRVIYDPIRRKYLIVQPEELVRQLLLQYLLQEKQYDKNRIAIEKGITINGRIKRFDMFVYRKDMSAFMLIECKAPTVKLDDATFRQAAWYNFELRADYLLVTNGISSHCFAINHDEKSYQQLAQIPDFE